MYDDAQCTLSAYKDASEFACRLPRRAVICEHIIIQSLAVALTVQLNAQVHIYRYIWYMYINACDA